MRTISTPILQIVVEVSPVLGDDERGCHCNSPRTPPAFASDRAHSRRTSCRGTRETFHKRMRSRQMRNRLDLVDFEHAQFGKPALKAKESIIAGCLDRTPGRAMSTVDFKFSRSKKTRRTR